MNNFERENNELYPNIMLLGFSGAGKSSLINRIFELDIVDVSDVRQETQGFENIYYGKKYGMSVNIIDTDGCEENQWNAYYNAVHDRIINGVKGQLVHIIWYCIQVSKKKIQDIDKYILNNLLKEESIQKRLCIVITKCDEDTENGDVANAFRKVISEEIHYQVPIFETTANAKYQFDIDKLIKWSTDLIDEKDLKNKFIFAASASEYCKNKKEFAKAIKENKDEIIIEGKLKDSVVTIKAAGPVAWGVCFSALAIAIAIIIKGKGNPATTIVGTTMGLVAPVAAVTVLGPSAAATAMAIAVVSGGVGVLTTLRDEYEIVEKNEKYIKLKRKKG